MESTCLTAFRFFTTVIPKDFQYFATLFQVWKGIDGELFSDEGRLIIAEFTRFYFIGAYVPNSGRGLVNLESRGKWEELFLKKIKELDEKKPVIYAGDLNVAHNEIGGSSVGENSVFEFRLNWKLFRSGKS